ncbi:lipase family protein [Nannocystaceae bacterium ST9]
MPLSLTTLTEPSNSTTTTLPAGFDASIAYFLGQCCSLTYAQFGASWGASLDTSSLTALNVAGNTATIKVVATLTSSQSVGTGIAAGDAGGYVTLPAGFVIAVSCSSPPTGVPASFTVVALRGTRTFAEWIEDAEALPAKFCQSNTSLFGSGWGSVHSGFLAAYAVGTEGAVGSEPPANPGAGSIAAQVRSAITGLASTQPIYVTGHSLGGGLASLCAMDLAANLSFTAVSMYSLASPRVAVGASPVPTYDDQVEFVQNYQQYVPNSFRIVHAADIVPILPPSSLTLGPLTLTAMHVTDAWSTSKQSGGLTSNVISFCAQTGDIGGNHACDAVYLPYLQALATGFGS